MSDEHYDEFDRYPDEMSSGRHLPARRDYVAVALTAIVVLILWLIFRW